MKVSLLLINLILFFQCFGFVLFQIWLKSELQYINEHFNSFEKIILDEVCHD